MRYSLVKKTVFVVAASLLAGACAPAGGTLERAYGEMPGSAFNGVTATRSIFSSSNF